MSWWAMPPRRVARSAGQPQVTFEQLVHMMVDHDLAMLQEKIAQGRLPTVDWPHDVSQRSKVRSTMAKQAIKFGTDGWRAGIADDYTFENVRYCAQGTAELPAGRRPGRPRHGRGL